jgi:hypothetical protein
MIVQKYFFIDGVICFAHDALYLCVCVRFRVYTHNCLQSSTTTTLKVSISPGEMEVLKCLFRDSITHLTGWEPMMRYNDNNNINAALNTQRENSTGGTSPRFRTGGPGMEEDLF